MSLVVTGSIGIDDVQTPHGRVQGVLGGSAVYFSVSAALFGPVRLVGAVGKDFPEEHLKFLSQKNIDLQGLEIRQTSKTFRWSGNYEGDMNEARTLRVDLNVLAEKAPVIPSSFKDSRFVFLAATHPKLQQSMAAEFSKAQMILCDTRDLWIENEKAELTKLLNHVTGIVLNDGETRLFTGEHSLIKAARRILGYGPDFVIIKKGEHGAMLFTRDSIIALPGYPTEKVKDPTGAGDSFAGGLMGYLAAQGEYRIDHLPRGMAFGAITASFTIEDFSLRGIERVSRAMVDERLQRYIDMLKI